MNQRHWLNAAEYIAIVASVGGTVASVITQKIILTTTPLTLALVLNTINRQRQLNQLQKTHKLNEVYDCLMSDMKEYSFYKLETQEQIEALKKAK
jgi:hypothetical protein